MKQNQRFFLALAGAVIMASATASIASNDNSPTVELFENTSNVYARAQVNVSSGVVRYLGRFTDTAGCEAACLNFVDDDGAVCHSFSFHHANFPQPDFAGACYAVADHSWSPVTPSALITSGRVSGSGPEPAPCGGTAFGSCRWVADPVCLAGGNDIPGFPATLTPAQALDE